MRSLKAFLAASLLGLAAGLGAVPLISTFAGGGLLDGPALGAALAAPMGLCFDNLGRLVFVDNAHGAVRRYDPVAGTVTTLTGLDSNMSFGNGGPAALANLANPQGVWVNPASGDVFVTDASGEQVRRISASTGLIDAVAGNGSSGYMGDGGPATAARLQFPMGIGGDSAGNLYVADSINHVIRKIDVSTVPWTISTFAGGAGHGFFGDGGPATSAWMNGPSALAVDTSGQVYFFDSYNARIRRVDTAGNITTVAGTGVAGFSGDGGPALAAELNSTNGLAFDAAGDLFMTDNGRVREVAAVSGAIVPSSVISTVAGLGTNLGSGDGGLASAADLVGPWGLAFDAAGDLFISQTLNVYAPVPGSGEHGNAIRRIDAATGNISTVAGSGLSIWSGDGGQALQAQIEEPFGAAVGPSGELYVAERDNQRVRKVAPDGTISTVAGTGLGGFSGDSGPATAATFRFPISVAVSAGGELYILDSANGRVRKVDVGGTITTAAGGGGGPAGADYTGPATGVSLLQPVGIYLEPGSPGRLFIADFYRVRVVDLGTGTLKTFAGNGTGAIHDGVPATTSGLNSPGGGMGEDAAGNFYFTDDGAGVVRKVDPAGIISTVVGNYTFGDSGDGGPATAAKLTDPRGLAVGPAGDLFIADQRDSTVRWVDSGGTIHHLAGAAVTYAFSGDGGPAASGLFDEPLGLAMNGAGDLFVADVFNNRIRLIPGVGSTPLPTATVTASFTASPTSTPSPSPTPTATQSPSPLPSPCAGQYLLQWGGTGNVNGAFHAPVGVAAAPSGNVYVVDGNNMRVQEFGPSGAFITQWGGFSSPNGVAVGASGNVYVVDYTTNQVLEFSAGGTPITQWGSGGGGNGQFNGPIGLGVAPSGNVYVADTSNNRIQEFTASGAYVTQWGSFGTGSGQFGYPRAVAFDAAGNVYVADSARDRVQVFTASGAYLFQIGGSGTGNGQFDSPNALALDGGGNIYVLDTNNARVEEFAPDGTYLGQWGGLGGGTGQFSQPNGIAIDAAGAVYVGDLLHDRVEKFGCTAFSPTPTVTATATVSATFTATPSASPAATPTAGPCGVIRTLAGDGLQPYGGDGGAATAAGLSLAWGPGSPGGSVAADGAGNVYIADALANRVRKIDAVSGIISTVAGTGNSVTSGDGGLATAAGVSRPVAVLADAAGDLYIGDSNARVRKVDASSGFISTVVGAAGPGYGGDGGLATVANISGAFGPAGDLYIADQFNQRVRKIDAASGIISTVAGSGAAGFSGDGGAATAASLHYPSGVAVDAAGDLYIVDSGNDRVRKVDAATGDVSTVVGNGGAVLGDGGPATAGGLDGPVEVVLDAAGNLYITDFLAERVRMVTVATGIITTVAGNGFNPGGGGFGGDGGPATSAKLSAPVGLALDSAGNIYIGDVNNFRVREVYVCPVAPSPTPTATPSSSPTPSPTATIDLGCGLISTVAGPGGVDQPAGLATDAAGDLFIADYGSRTVRRVDAVTGFETTVAGSGAPYYTGDGGPATLAAVDSPEAVAVDAAGNLYIACYWNDAIRRVDGATGIITAVAGNGTFGYNGDNIPATTAQLFHPAGVAVDPSGRVYLADISAKRVRYVDPATGLIRAFAGNGLTTYNGDGIPALGAHLGGPNDLLIAPNGDVYIDDSEGYRVRLVSAATGLISTVAGTGASGYNGDGIAATSAQLGLAQALALDGAGNLYIADSGNHRVRRVDAVTGLISTVAGNGSSIYNGDGIPATSAQINGPDGLAFNSAGDLFIAEGGGSRVRKVACLGAPFPIQTATASATPSPAFSPTPSPTPLPPSELCVGSYLLQWGVSGTGNGHLAQPQGVAVGLSGNIYVADTDNQRIQYFSPTGAYLGQWGGSGNGNGQFNNGVYTIAVAPSGNVYAADVGHDRIQVFDPSGVYLSQWGSPGTGNGQFQEPYSLAVAPSGNVYVADGHNNRIQEFTSTGTFVTTWGAYGTGPGQFYVPWGIAFDASGNVYVADVGNARIEKFTAAGVYLAQWSGPGTGAGKLGSPTGLATDAAGDFFVGDTANNRIQEFSPSGTYLTQWGTLGAGNGQFGEPTGVALDAMGNVYVADMANNRIQKFGCASGSASPSPTGTAALTATNTPSAAASFTLTPSPSASPTLTPTPSPAFSPTPTAFAGPREGSPYAYPQPYSSGPFRIAYPMRASGAVEIDIFNERGDLAAVIQDRQGPGEQSSLVDASRFAAGVYLYMVRLNYDDGRRDRFGPLRFARLP